MSPRRQAGSEVAAAFSRRSRALLAALGVAVGVLGCEFGRDRPTQPVLGRMEVRSDPSGALILVDGQSTGAVTPTTINPPAGQRRLTLERSVGFELLSWERTIAVPETALVVIDAALVGGCFQNCPFRLEGNRVGCTVNGRGDFCSTVFNPTLILSNSWPRGSGNAYVAGLRLLVGGIVGSGGDTFEGDTLASLVYQSTWLGRSTISLTAGADAHVAAFRTWSDPGPALPGLLPLVGIEVDQRVVQPSETAFPDLRDVVYFVFRLKNVTNDPLFRDWHPEIPVGGFAYTGLYAGMSLDADIGDARDDVGTYLPDSGVAFIYDLDFRDDALSADYANRPALVGLTQVESPAGAARRPFSLWRISDDWDRRPDRLGDELQGFGYRVLAAQLVPGDLLPDCPGDEIGFCADEPADYRLSLTAGPVDLPPGGEAVWVAALVVAEPVPGTFTSGVAMAPGQPSVADRPIEAVAQSLVAQARRAVALWPDVRSRVGL